MRPLQSIAMGLVIVALHAPVADGFDALPDPIGWVLVLVGLGALPADLPRRPVTLVVAALAGVVSVALWFPAVRDTLADTHDSLSWVVNLPQLGFAGLLCLVLAARAAEAGDAAPALWLRLLVAGFVAAAVLPVLVLGADVAAAEDAASITATLSLILLIVLLFTYSARLWAGSRQPGRSRRP